MPERHWYACYTRPRHEKKVEERLRQRGLEAFLPLAPRKSTWKDRVKIVDFPMFPGYVFARTDLPPRSHLLAVPGIVALIEVDGAPAVIRDDEIDNVRRFARVLAEGGGQAVPRPLPGVGQRVRVKDGPFRGVEGIVVEHRSRRRLLVGIPTVGQGWEVDLPESVLLPISTDEGWRTP